jgi:hypothetical protein
MEKEEVKSKWDELAREIGAEVSPETEKIVEAVSSQPDASASYSPPASKKQERAPTKRPAAGWDNLASEFGLPVPEPVEPPVVEETVVPITKQVVSRAPESDTPRRERHGDRPPRERQPRERQPRDSQRSERQSRDHEASERRPSRGRSRGRRPSERDRESREDQPRRGRRDRSERHERRPAREHREVETEYVEGVEPREMPEIRDEIRAEAREPEREVPQEPQKPSPAVSLWQKIFGTPSEPPKPVEPVARETDSGEFDDFESTSQYEISRRQDEESWSASRPAVELETDARSSDALDDELEVTAREEHTEQRERRPRRRRRGRGGRVDKRDESRSTDAARHAAGRDDFDGEADELDDLAGEDADVDAEDDDVASGNGADHGEHSGSRRSRSALQRSIPSWDEAIGHIVDLNMQARSQRRPSSQPGSQRGRSRGRRNR